MKRTDVQRKLRHLLLCAAAYLLSDLPIQLTGFLDFGSWIGIKCFLPVTLGLFFGPWGVAGGMLGCIAAAGILHTPLMKLPLRHGVLLAAIVREGRIIIPGGMTTIEPGDHVLVVTNVTGLTDLKHILA